MDKRWQAFGAPYRAAQGRSCNEQTAMVATPAHAQDAVEAEMIGYHQLCDGGDRRACVRFGILIGRNQQRHADRRSAHIDRWWWER